MAYEPVVTIRTGSTQTTNGSTVNVISLPVPSAGQMMRVTYQTVAKSGSNMRSCMRTCTFRNNGGTITILGSVLDLATAQADAALSTAGCTLAVDTNVPVVTVTGVIATTIDWIAKATIEVFY